MALGWGSEGRGFKFWQETSGKLWPQIAKTIATKIPSQFKECASSHWLHKAASIKKLNIYALWSGIIRAHWNMRIWKSFKMLKNLGEKVLMVDSLKVVEKIEAEIKQKNNPESNYTVNEDFFLSLNMPFLSTIIYIEIVWYSRLKHIFFFKFNHLFLENVLNFNENKESWLHWNSFAGITSSKFFIIEKKNFTPNELFKDFACQVFHKASSFSYW